MILCLEACAAQEICGVMMQFLALRSGLSPLDWLSRNNIKTSSIKLPTIQSICQILLNNKLTTAVVDKDNSILHLRNILFINHTLCLREKRAVKEDHIRLCKQLIKRNILRKLGTSLTLINIISKNLHIQSIKQLSSSLTDPSKTNDTGSLSVKLDHRIIPVAPVIIILPFTGLNSLIMMAIVRADLKKKTKSILANDLSTALLYAHPVRSPEVRLSLLQ